MIVPRPYLPPPVKEKRRRCKSEPPPGQEDLQKRFSSRKLGSHPHREMKRAPNQVLSEKSLNNS